MCHPRNNNNNTSNDGENSGERGLAAEAAAHTQKMLIEFIILSLPRNSLSAQSL
jgi:hypothetical protein